MGLSAHEREMLEQLENQFKEDDPKFAEAMEIKSVPRYSVRRIAAASAAVLAGFFLLYLGASAMGVAVNALLGGLGFVLMVAGGYVALQRTKFGSGTPSEVHAPETTGTSADGKRGKDPGKEKGKARRFLKAGFGDLAFWSLFWWI